MGAASGKNASFNFAGTTYSATDCLQSTNLASSVQELTYFCGGEEKAEPGVTVHIFAATLTLSATETTKLTALAEGSTGVFEYHPGSDSAGNLEVESTKGLVTRSDITAAPDGLITMDLTIRLTGITKQAAT